MKKYLLGAALALLVVSAAHAQTTHNLPNSDRVDYIDYGTYMNLFDDDMPVIINGVNFYISITAHTDPGSLNLDTTYSSIQFWNQATGTRATIPLTGTISTLDKSLNATPVIQGFFSGVHSGSFTLTLVPHYPKPPCGRGCYLLEWAQVNSTLTID